jgi:excisionase family DNA binding protein
MNITSRNTKPSTKHVATELDGIGRISELMIDEASMSVSIERASGERTTVSLPRETLELIASVLRETSRGRSVQIISTDEEVTTQEAADILHVSRPYVVKLLAQNNIPFRTVGTRRRILLNDLLAYKERETAKRLSGVDALVSESQNLGLY